MLHTEWKQDWKDKAEVDQMLGELGLAEEGHIRAEAMDHEEFISLAEALRARFGS